MANHKRILLKLSGEALAGEAGFGLDPARAGQIVDEVVEVVDSGVQVAIVAGGGNFFRGIRASETGLQRISVDYMGMLATAINALALEDYFKARGREARVLSAIRMEPLAESFSRRGALAHLEAGRVVIFAAGTGSPYFTTDTAASLRAIEIGADLLAKATKVDGVYDDDPVQNPQARRYEKISYAEVLSGRLGVMDAAAVSLCRENSLPVVVFDLNRRGNIGRLARGEKIGTLIC